jgi:hypothetical protein
MRRGFKGYLGVSIEKTGKEKRKQTTPVATHWGKQ